MRHKDTNLEFTVKCITVGFYWNDDSMNCLLLYEADAIPCIGDIVCVHLPERAIGDPIEGEVVSREWDIAFKNGEIEQTVAVILKPCV